jgi:hypothetical protein
LLREPVREREGALERERVRVRDTELMRVRVFVAVCDCVGEPVDVTSAQ